jgi:MFS transporter, OPA family, sugar phosphate sensor protein UhpC
MSSSVVRSRGKSPGKSPVRVDKKNDKKNDSDNESSSSSSSWSLRAYQWRVFVTLYVAFMAYTISKRSLGFAAPSGIASGELSAALVGQLSTALSVAFAFGKPLGGVLCDLYNPIVLMALGLALSGLSAWGLASADSASVMLLWWSVNGLAQSPAWPPITLLLTRWFADHERATWWAAMSSTQTAGGAIAAALITNVAQRTGSWRTAMSTAGALALATSLVIVPLVAPSPASVGLQLTDADGKPIAVATAAKNAPVAAKLPVRDILKIAASSANVWLYSLASMALYFAKEIFATWFIVAMVQRGFDAKSPALGGFMFAYEAAGIPGCLASAFVSRYFFANRRSLTGAAFAVPIFGAVLLLSQLDANSNALLYSGAMAAIGFSINAIQTMASMGYTEENDKRCSGTISGIVGMAAYFGAALAGAPLAAYVSADIRSGFFYPLLFAATVVAVALLAVPKKKDKQQ